MTDAARAHYIDPVNPENKLGDLRVEEARWEVKGPHTTHEFRSILTARTSDRFIIHDHIVEHWIGGQKIEGFGWGHGVVEAYKSSQTWEYRTGAWHVDLIAAHIFRNDLPCCGGKFVSDKEIADYFTLSHGHCHKCGVRWDVTDGCHFSRAR